MTTFSLQTCRHAPFSVEPRRRAIDDPPQVSPPFDLFPSLLLNPLRGATYKKEQRVHDILKYSLTRKNLAVGIYGCTPLKFHGLRTSVRFIAVDLEQPPTRQYLGKVRGLFGGVRAHLGRCPFGVGKYRRDFVPRGSVLQSSRQQPELAMSNLQSHRAGEALLL